MALDVRGALPPAEASAGQLVGTEASDAGIARKARGPSWRAFVLPVRDGVVGEASLLLGYLREFGDDFAATPDPGSCLVTQGVAAASSRARAGERLRARTLRMRPLDALAREIVADVLYAAFDEETGSLLAIGRFDAEGNSRCVLPEKGLALSTGFGLSRFETRASASDADIEIPVVRRGRLRVDPAPGVGGESLEGSIVRIGRESSQPLEGVGRGAIEALRLPLSLVGDLFRVVPNPSENLQAREILQTSFLVGRSAFSLALEPGSYVVALVRPDSGVRCIEKILIESAAASPLRCASARAAKPPSSASPGSSASFSARLDASFLPQRLLGSSQMRDWMTAAGLTHALVAEAPASNLAEPDGASRRSREDNSGARDFTIASFPETPLRLPGVGPFSGWFAPLEGSAAETRAQQARVVTSSDLLDAERRVASYLGKGDATLLPLGGTGEPDVSDRVTPFLLTTRYRFARDATFSPDDAEILVSNGMDVEWLEPAPLEGRFPLRLPLQQRFRARVTIPRGHRPDYAELWVDGALHRRWVIQRADASAEDTFLIDERIDKTQDFTVAVSVWGQAFLPELIYGSSTAPTVAFTRAYCIDANENGICEAAR